MFKNRKAQQLVEFLLVAPFIVIFLGILTEYAYALNCNLTLAQGLKEVTSTVYREIVPDISQSAVRDYVKSELTNYLKNNNVPIGGSYALDVGYNIAGSNAVFVASYNYTPAFTLPNVFFHILPDKFTFMATSAVPAAFLSPNNYGTSISSTDLDGIWNISHDFSSLSSFDTSKNGIMNLPPSATPNILFLVPKGVVDTANSYYALVPWNGNPNFESRVLNLSDGHLYTCDTSSCSDTGISLMSAYSGCQNFIFVHDSDVNPLDLSQLQSYWTHVKDSCVPTNNPPCTATSNKISDSTVDGILKRTLGMIVPPLNLSVGNYDGIDVSLYNMSVSSSNLYQVDTLGSKVIVHDQSENIAPIVNGFNATNVKPDNNDTQFGT